MYQDHLILPLFLLFYHSVILSLPPSLSQDAFFRNIWDSPWPLPPTHKVNLKVCKVVLLCVLTSCGHCVLNLTKIKDGVKTNNKILASSVWKSIASNTEKYVLIITQCFEKKLFPLFNIQVNDVKSLQGDFWITLFIIIIIIWNVIFFFVFSLCSSFLKERQVERRSLLWKIIEQKTTTTL